MVYYLCQKIDRVANNKTTGQPASPSLFPMESLKRGASAFTPRGTVKKARANAPPLSPATRGLLAANAAQAKEIARMRKENEVNTAERERMRKLLPGAHAPGVHDRLAQANVLCGIIQRCGPKVRIPPSFTQFIHTHPSLHLFLQGALHTAGCLPYPPRPSRSHLSQSNEVAKEVGVRNCARAPNYIPPTLPCLHTPLFARSCHSLTHANALPPCDETLVALCCTATPRPVNTSPSACTPQIVRIAQIVDALNAPARGAGSAHTAGAGLFATVNELHVSLVAARSALMAQRRVLAAAAHLSARVVKGTADPRAYSAELDRTCVWTTENSPERRLAAITTRVAKIASRVTDLRGLCADVGAAGGSREQAECAARAAPAAANVADSSMDSDERSVAATLTPRRGGGGASVSAGASAGASVDAGVGASAGAAPRAASPVQFATPPRASHREDWAATPLYSIGPSGPSPYRSAVPPRCAARASPRPAPAPRCIPAAIWLDNILPLLAQCELIKSAAGVRSTFRLFALISFVCSRFLFPLLCLLTSGLLRVPRHHEPARAALRRLRGPVQNDAPREYRAQRGAKRRRDAAARPRCSALSEARHDLDARHGHHDLPGRDPRARHRCDELGLLAEPRTSLPPSTRPRPRPLAPRSY